MKGLLNKISNNPFLKVFSFNSIVVIVKLLTSFIVSKVSAIYLGPSGYAIVGNLKNVLQGVLGISTSGFESGLIKYIAENKNDKKQLNVVVTSAFILSISISIILGLFIFLFSNQLSISVLKDASLAFVFKYLALFLPLISLNFLVVYILNGLQKFKLYSILIIIANALNALTTVLFVYFYNLAGALLASVLFPLISFIVSLLIKEVRTLFVDAIVHFEKVSITFFKTISTYILMATYSTILISLCYLFIRNRIILNFGTDTAGLWEAMNKLSSFYMMFFSSLFTLYLLPLLALNKTVTGYVSIMRTFFKYLIPFVSGLFLAILLFRVFIINVVLTNEFELIEQFFYLQLLGDFIKIIAFSFAYQFHAKKMISSYFITDAILYGSFYVFGIYLLKDFNLQGVFYAYIISTLLYLISVCMFVYFNRTKYLKNEKISV